VSAIIDGFPRPRTYRTVSRERVAATAQIQGRSLIVRVPMLTMISITYPCIETAAP
jgi:hypothetical protein